MSFLKLWLKSGIGAALGFMVWDILTFDGVRFRSVELLLWDGAFSGLLFGAVFALISRRTGPSIKNAFLTWLVCASGLILLCLSGIPFSQSLVYVCVQASLFTCTGAYLCAKFLRRYHRKATK